MDAAGNGGRRGDAPRDTKAAGARQAALGWTRVITDPRKPPAFYAELYRTNGLTGGHIIKLGPNNDVAAKEAVAAWQGGMQVGGGINEDNAKDWLDAGASKVSRSRAILLSVVLERV